MTSTAAENQLFCILTTDMSDEYKVPANKINVQASVTQDELNQVLRQLLASMKRPTNKIFEFLVGGELLRGSLRSHMLKLNRGTEQNVEVFYAEAFGTPQIENSVQQPQWINRIFFAES